MKDLRKRFDLFCFRNRDKGIPNLMLYVVLGNALVMILSMINGGSILYQMLCFDKELILQGQVWRLVSYVFTQSGSGLLNLLFLYFFYMLGRSVENSIGTLKFNIFYFSGVILMDVFAMIFCPTGTDPLSYALAGYYASQMAYYLHLSLILTFATTHPDSHFMIFFLIPVRAWLIALVYLILVLVEVINLSCPTLYFPHNLFPLVALANYFLLMGGSIKNLFPSRGPRRPASKPKTQGRVIHFHTENKASDAPKADFTHRCTVCGRTDVTHPQLEFRYCSRCNGYHCYCEDHISDHTHIE